MPNTPKQIGAYTIERELGRGGMGVVYLAKDARLDRNVAIKVLPDVVSHDPERLARFEREARLLASVNHPNIGGIYGLEEADGQRFLVLEYLQGETLADRLERGAIAPTDAIHICSQIAAALEVAHETGVIHRDLKPSNVILDYEDNAKVLDFGLAKGDATMAESSGDLSASPTMTVGATAIGVVLGTAAYMSPEQARGKPVDRRTDIWSFGCVLYECLTGTQLFKGETVSDTIAKILEREPDWDALPKETPDRVRELIRRCLEKKARARMRDMGDARIELEEVASGKTSSISGMTAGVPLADHKRSLMVAWTAAAVAAVLAIVMGGLALSRSGAPEQTLMRTEVTAPSHIDIGFTERSSAISPDGRTIAFAGFDSTGNSYIYTRDVASSDVVAVPGTDGGFSPFWSPDSRKIGFFAGSRLKIVSLDDGQVESIADVSSDRGATWSGDQILFAGAEGPIYKVSLDDGEVEAVTVVDTAAGHTAHRFPEFLRGGKRFSYAVLPARTGQTGMYVSDLDGMEPVHIMDAFGRPVYAEPGYLIWQRGRRLVAQRFDAKSLKLSGKPFPIGEAPVRSGTIGAAALSVARNGTLLQGSPRWPTTRLEWQDIMGRTLERLDLEDSRLYTEVTLSPDGKRAVVTIAESPEESNLWLVDLERASMTRFTSGQGNTSQPFWWPDGDRILYASDREGPWKLYIRSLDRPNEDAVVIDPKTLFANPRGWSADGQYVMYSRSGAGTALDLWIAGADGDEASHRPFLATPYNEDNANISNNGKWVAYGSDETGRNEVFVTSFPQAGRRYRISNGGGFAGGWSPDDRTFYYSSADGWVMEVPVVAGETFSVGTPRRLRRVPDGVFDSELARDGSRLLTIVTTAPLPDATLTVTTGWRSQETQ